MKKRHPRPCALLALVLSLSLLSVPVLAAEQSPRAPLPCPVTADPNLAVSTLDLRAVSLPDFSWTGGSQAYEREVLIRWMAEYGKQFYALPEGNPWKAADVQVVPNTLKGPRSGALGDPNWTPGDSERPHEPGKDTRANDWVTLAVKPVGGIDAVRPLFRGGVPRGTGAYAGYVLLQYHVTLDLEGGRWVASHNRDGSVLYVSPAWNTVPPPALGTWTEAQLQTWRDDLGVKVGGFVPGDTQADWQQAGDHWAEYFTRQFLDFYNTGHPGMSDDVKVLAVELVSRTPENKPGTLTFHVKFAFRPIWGVENGMAFLAAYTGGSGGTAGQGELADYVVAEGTVTLTRDNSRKFDGQVFWQGSAFQT